MACGSNFLVDYAGDSFIVFYKSGVRYWCLPVAEADSGIDTTKKVPVAIQQQLSLRKIFFNGKEHCILAQGDDDRLHFIQVSADLKAVRSTSLPIQAGFVQDATMCNGPPGTAFIACSDWNETVGNTIAHSLRVRGLIHSYEEISILNDTESNKNRSPFQTIRSGGFRNTVFTLFLPQTMFKTPSVSARFEIFTINGQRILSHNREIKTGVRVVVPLQDILFPFRLSANVYILKIRLGNTDIVHKMVLM